MIAHRLAPRSCNCTCADNMGTDTAVINETCLSQNLAMLEVNDSIDSADND